MVALRTYCTVGHPQVLSVLLQLALRSTTYANWSRVSPWQWSVDQQSRVQANPTRPNLPVALRALGFQPPAIRYRVSMRTGTYSYSPSTGLSLAGFCVSAAGLLRLPHPHPGPCPCVLQPTPPLSMLRPSPNQQFGHILRSSFQFPPLWIPIACLPLNPFFHHPGQSCPSAVTIPPSPPASRPPPLPTSPHLPGLPLGCGSEHKFFKTCCWSYYP